MTHYFLALALWIAQTSIASIEGTVIAMGSGEPLSGARVMLDPAPISNGPLPCPAAPMREEEGACVPQIASTGADGKFVLRNVPPGRYRLFATRSGGYVPAEYGQRTATGEGIPFELTAGQRMTGIVLAMSATGAISGRVFDRDGEPVGRAQVQALRWTYRNGVRTLAIVQNVESNDRGEYRLYWLAPGTYYVSALPDNPSRHFENIPGLMPTGPNTVEPMRFGSYEQTSSPVVRKRALKSGEGIEEITVPVYHPGVIESQAASAIAVAAGGTTGGVDISIASGYVQTHHVRGRAMDGATGQPLARAFITALSRSIESLRITPTTQTDTNGVFDLPGVRPGSYVLVTQVGGIVPIEVTNRDVENVAIIASARFKLSGRFVIDGPSTGAAPKIQDLRIASLARDPELPGLDSPGLSFSPPPESDGSFVVDGATPGDFRVSVRGLGANAYVKSMRMGRDDVLNDGLHLQGPPENALEVTIGVDAARVHGTVVDSRQQPLVNRTVVLIPDLRLRRRHDLYHSSAAGSGGRFQIQGVAPGSYKLFAFDQIENGAWLDPEFIRNFEDRGVSVEVRSGGDVTVEVTVIP